jgi:hypothetical protein
VFSLHCMCCPTFEGMCFFVETWETYFGGHTSGAIKFKIGCSAIRHLWFSWGLDVPSKVCGPVRLISLRNVSERETIGVDFCGSVCSTCSMRVGRYYFQNRNVTKTSWLHHVHI